MPFDPVQRGMVKAGSQTRRVHERRSLTLSSRRDWPLGDGKQKRRKIVEELREDQDKGASR